MIVLFNPERKTFATACNEDGEFILLFVNTEQAEAVRADVFGDGYVVAETPPPAEPLGTKRALYLRHDADDVAFRPIGDA